ncbi:U3 snoRNP protein [Phlyctochytrium planicorne]|nr:U3 snoRNP protein [Phlyctochytrium planicorne]
MSNAHNHILAFLASTHPITKQSNDHLRSSKVSRFATGTSNHLANDKLCERHATHTVLDARRGDHVEGFGLSEDLERGSSSGQPQRHRDLIPSITLTAIQELLPLLTSVPIDLLPRILPHLHKFLIHRFIPYIETLSHLNQTAEFIHAAPILLSNLSQIPSASPTLALLERSWRTIRFYYGPVSRWWGGMSSVAVPFSPPLNPTASTKLTLTPPPTATPPIRVMVGRETEWSPLISVWKDEGEAGATTLILNGSVVVTATSTPCEDGRTWTVRFRDRLTGEVMREWESPGVASEIVRLVEAGKGVVLVAGKYLAVVGINSFENRALRGEVWLLEEPECVAVDPKGRIAVGFGNEISLLSTIDGSLTATPIATFQTDYRPQSLQFPKSTQPLVVAILSNGSLLTFLTSPTSLHLLSTQHLPSFPEQSTFTQISASTTKIACSSTDGTVWRYQKINGAWIKSFVTRHEGGAETLFMSEDGQVVASTSTLTRDVCIMNLSNGRKAIYPSLHPSAITSITMTADGTEMVSGSKDRTVRVWDVNAIFNHIPKASEPLTTPVSHAAISPNGRWAAASNKGSGIVRLWDLRRDESTCKSLEGHEGDITSIAFERRGGGGVIATGGEDGSVRIWDLESAVELYSYRLSNKLKPQNLEFSLGGTHLRITVSSTTLPMPALPGTVTIMEWNWKTGRPPVTLRPGTLPSALLFPNQCKKLCNNPPPDSIRYRPHAPPPTSPPAFQIDPERGWITSSSGQYLTWLDPRYRSPTAACSISFSASPSRTRYTDSRFKDRGGTLWVIGNNEGGIRVFEIPTPAPPIQTTTPTKPRPTESANQTTTTTTKNEILKLQPCFKPTGAPPTTVTTRRSFTTSPDIWTISLFTPLQTYILSLLPPLPFRQQQHPRGGSAYPYSPIAIRKNQTSRPPQQQEEEEEEDDPLSHFLLILGWAGIGVLIAVLLFGVFAGVVWFVVSEKEDNGGTEVIGRIVGIGGNGGVKLTFNK